MAETTPENDLQWGFSTRAIHVGQEADQRTGAVIPPIYMTSTFENEDVGVPGAYAYSRRANPTRAALEQCIASLDGGTHAFAFASGMAAVTAASHLLKGGERALIVEDVYGNTRQLYTRILHEREIGVDFVDFIDHAAVARALESGPRLVWLESPTSPLLKVLDLPAITRMAHAAGALVAIDNTVASPYLQRPLDIGIDIVHYSTTKYHAGHSDLLGGALVVRDPHLAERLTTIQYVTGGVASPLDAWLTLRGMKTMSLRMERHAANALQLARVAEGHPAVTRVIYPGLRSHPQYALATRQMRLPGGILSIELQGGREAVRHVVKTLRLFAFAASFGGVESLIGHPATMTHAFLSVAERQAVGIEDGLVRLSVGIEEPEDLAADLLHALDGLIH